MFLIVATNARSAVDKIPMKMRREIPLPIPISVILSPIQVENIDPATSIITMLAPITHLFANIVPEYIVSDKPPALCHITVMPIACITASPSVTYLVILLSFFLPSSPCLEYLSRAGIAAPRSCTIIDALIYGDNSQREYCAVGQRATGDCRQKSQKVVAFGCREYFFIYARNREPAADTIQKTANASVINILVRISLSLKCIYQCTKHYNTSTSPPSSLNLRFCGFGELIRLNGKFLG